MPLFLLSKGGFGLSTLLLLGPLRFAIQWVEDFRDGAGNLVSIDPSLREHPQVEVIGRYFEGDEYERRLAATDIMVLPYRSPYRFRVSRVVIEAMLNGMPVIATKGTTLFEQAEEYGVVVGCKEGDVESLAAAILEVAERFEMLRASAEGKVNAAAVSFSVGYFQFLSAYAVEYRYPGETATKEMAREALRYCSKFREQFDCEIGRAHRK